jgi:hypothetical protein
VLNRSQHRLAQARALAQDCLRRHREHPPRAVAAIARNMNARDLDLAAAVADQDRRAGIAADPLAGVQHQAAGADRLAHLAVVVRGHGMPAVLPVAGDRGGSAAWRRLPAESQRHDLVGQAVGERQHHPVGADGLPVLQGVVAGTDLVVGNARVCEISPGAIAGEEMQRVRGHEPPRAAVVDAVRRGHDLVARDDHATAGGAAASVERPDRRPRMARHVHVLAMDREMISAAADLQRVVRFADRGRRHQNTKRRQQRQATQQLDSHSLFPCANFFVVGTLRLRRL